MYNEERKLRYIADSKNKARLKYIFITAEPFETKEGCDLCEFSNETIQLLVDSAFGIRKSTTDSAISIIRRYASWCKENGYQVSDAALNGEVDTFRKLRRKMLSSPAHLEKILNTVYHPVSNETTDCLYRCYLWMAFAGLPEEEVLEVTTDEIDFTMMTIEHGGKSYEIPREAIPAFRMACEAEQFLFIHPDYTTYRKRLPGPYLMRGVRADRLSLHNLQDVRYKHFTPAGFEVDYQCARLSGLYYKTFEMERMGDPVNFDAFVVEMAEESIKRRGKAPADWAKFISQTRRRIKGDYENWKKAFSV